MQLVEVNIIGIQPLQRGVALLDDVTPIVAGGEDVVIVHAPVNFGRQHDPVAFAIAPQPLADGGLAAAAPVDIGGVEKVDAGCLWRGSMMSKLSASGVGPPKFMQPRQSSLTMTASAPKRAIIHEILLMSPLIQVNCSA